MQLPTGIPSLLQGIPDLARYFLALFKIMHAV